MAYVFHPLISCKLLVYFDFTSGLSGWLAGIYNTAQPSQSKADKGLRLTKFTAWDYIPES